ncbi:MAG: hypothetical protein U0470_03960 [Anaerolineae bacterium]
MPERKLANDLIAPLVRKRQSTIVGRYDTGIAVVNPGASAATVRTSTTTAAPARAPASRSTRRP